MFLFQKASALFASISNKKESEKDLEVLQDIKAPTPTTTKPAPISTTTTTTTSPTSVNTPTTPKPEPKKPEEPKKEEPKKPVAVAAKSLDGMFQTYYELDEHESDEQIIGMNGIMKFVQDLGLAAEEVEPLVLFYKLDCKVQLQISKPEFAILKSTYGLNDLKAVSAWVNSQRDTLFAANNAKEFKKFYMFCFNYNKEPNSRVLDKDIAIPTWQLLLKHKYKALDKWNEYIATQFNKAITKDIWQQFEQFICEVGDDFSKYSSEQAWPVVIDEYVTWAKEKK